MIVSRLAVNIIRCSLPETGHGMGVINFNGFSPAVYCIFVICHEKVIYASYDTLINIFNLAYKIVPPGLATYFRFSFRFFKKGSCQLLAKVCARSTG